MKFGKESLFTAAITDKDRTQMCSLLHPKSDTKLLNYLVPKNSSRLF